MDSLFLSCYQVHEMAVGIDVFSGVAYLGYTCIDNVYECLQWRLMRDAYIDSVYQCVFSGGW